MSVAALRPPAVIYREEQFFDWWVYVLMALMAGFAAVSMAWWLGRAPDPAPAAAGWGLELPLGAAVGLLPLILVVFVLRMTTEVTPDELRVWFGWLPSYRRAVPVGSIVRVETVEFRPLLDHGGWGVRIARDGDRVLTARGNRGVRVHLADGTRLLIGSQTPERLARSIEQASVPGA